MYLSGSINDFLGILRSAEELEADSIHFISPNIVFVLAKNKQDYLYTKTNILVGQSILIPKSSYDNMKFYIDNAKAGSRRRGSIFYKEKIEVALFLPGRILFNESERLALEVDIPSFPLKKDVEFKLEESLQSAYNTEAPYLRISGQDLTSIQKQISDYKISYMNRTINTSDNTIRIEEEQLVLYHEYKGTEIRFETGIRTFVSNSKFPDMTYSFSDRTLSLFYWMSKMIMIEEVVFLPRPNYCVIEGHMSNMVVKSRVMLKNDHNKKNAL